MGTRVLNFLNRESVLTPSQHGFRSKRSTSTAVLSLSEMVNSYLNNMIVIGAFIDVKAAFDTVHHGILLNKLERYGFHEGCLQFFQSYLMNRRQMVQFFNTNSDFFLVTLGVPQGSVSEPFYFPYT